MRFFDTHTHVNFSAFSAKGGSQPEADQPPAGAKPSGGKNDREATIKRALDNQTWMINVGTQVDTSKAAVELAVKYPEGVYAAIGLHPIHTWQQMVDEEESHFKSRQEKFEEKDYEGLISEKVVAIGETGLDYFRIPETSSKEHVISKQKQAFVAQISFAKKHQLSLIVHCRDAYEDVLEILKAEYAGQLGVIHSFTDTWETAKKFLDLGCYIAFNGILTFDKTGRLAEVVSKMPFDRILTETDAPYLTPPPFRGKRNEPSYVRYIAQKIAEIRNMDTVEAAETAFNNACKLFKIKQ
ncbi:MAG: TatD family hydrolase [Candidatus Doudnabacteria bacterium]|nr:TatD family hydrolase [Candidatus Doudnabacteria bacterium]